MHVSRLSLDLDSWYDLPESERVDRMFSPDHTTEQVGQVGKFLASDSRVNEEMAAATERHAEEQSVVGHTQKLARARDDDDFEPKILRRSEAISLDGDDVGMNFTSVQRTIGDFVDTRRAMEFVDDDAAAGDDAPSGCPVHDAGTDESDCPVDSGILSFLETHNRANFLVPPREKRSLPAPR